MTEIVSLKSRADFLALKQGGASRFSSQCLLAFYLSDAPAASTESRLRYAFSINSRFYNAVERNRIKRLIKARLLQFAPEFSATSDVLFILSSKDRHGLKTQELFERQLHIDLDQFFKRIKKLVL